jgi:DNA-directed RNA polymerase specialized sigma24 family protein
VSTERSERYKESAAKSAAALSGCAAQGGGRGSKADRALVDGQVVQSCLAGDERSWERLYRKCHPRLRKAIELLLGADASDSHVIEEIAARVWYAVLKDNCRLLAAYDAERDSALDSFLMGLARIEILRYTRAERRRHSHEMSGGRRRLEEQRVSDWQLASMMEEFTSTLTPGERDFMKRFLTGPAEDQTEAELGDLPPTTVWTRRYRIRRKLNRFLENL